MASKFAEDLVAGTPARTGPRPLLPEGADPNKATPEQVTQAWLGHLGRLVQGSYDPVMGGSAGIGPSDVKGILGRQEEEKAAFSKIAGGNPALQRDLEDKVGARDLVTVGGLFFGGPSFSGGVGLAGAAAGTLGRLAAGASIGAGLGLTEGLVGGYDKSELPTLAKDYAVGTLMLGVPLEAAGAALGAGMHIKARMDVLRLAKEALDKRVRSVSEIESALAESPEVADFFNAVKNSDELRTKAKEELSQIRKEISSQGKTVSPKNIKDDPGLRDYVFNQLKEKHPDLSPNADPNVLWNLGRKEGILPRTRRALPEDAIPMEGDAAESARSAYRAVLGSPDLPGGYYSRARMEGAKEAARTAAFHAKRNELKVLLRVGRLRTYLEDLSTNPDILKIHRVAKNLVIDRATTVLRKTKYFGEAGPAFADMLHRFSVLREGTEGHWTRIIQDRILHGLSKDDLVNLNDYIRWGKPAANERVLKAANMWINDFYKMVADEAKGMNLLAKDRGLTAVFRGLKQEEQGAILKLQKLAEAEPGKEEAAQKAMDELLNKLGPEAQQLVKDIARLGGRIADDRGLHVVRPFEESAIKAPDYYKPELLQAMEKDDNHPVVQAIYQQVLNERPELMHPVTRRPYHDAVMREVHERLGIGGTSAPEYIWNNSLQWSRESIIDPKYRIEDPLVWMTKYAHAAASRLAAAKVFGPLEENFNAIWRQIATETGTGLGGTKFNPTGYGRQVKGKYEPETNLKLLTDIYDMAMGRGTPTRTGLKQAMDATLRHKIGFTTYLKQFSSLKNVAAAHGVANTLDAMGIVLSSRGARELADDLGATLADLVRVLADDTQAINPTNPVAKRVVKTLWGESASDQLRRTGTLIGDRFTRRVSAIAAGIKASKAARDVRMLGSSNRAERMVAEQARRWLEHMDVDVESVLQQGLTDAQRRQVMLSGARSTQFTSQVEDLPALATTSEWGRAASLLNKFSYQQGPFVVTHLLKEAAKGNMKPIIGFAVFLGFSDRAMNELLKALTNSSYDVATDMLIDSMFGKFGSVASDARKDPGSAIAGTLTGPITGLAGDVIGAPIQAGWAGLNLLQGDLPGATEHAGKALWHMSPATLRQLIYLMQTARGTKG